MKKIFEIFKKKRTYFKAISMILVLALMGQTVSLAVTAISETGLSIDEMISVDEAVPVDNSLETKPSIVGEVESSRDQYTKVYELSDGTFYEVISNDPIHESINGKWEEPINNLVEPTSVDEVTSYCDELVDSIAEEQNGGASTFSYIEKETGNHILQESYVINKQTFKPVASKTVSSYNRLLVKIPENFLSYSNTNQITIKQELSVVCNNPSGNPTGTLYAYGILENWGINKIDDVEYLTVLKSDGTHQKINPDNIKRQKNILDCVVVGVMDITCHFDITEICNKWNKHVLDNNGIYLRTSDNSTTATIEKCYVTRRFMVVDAYDRDFTYHSIDMGKAGQVLINDFTNTLTLQRNEMYYPTGKMPINLYRYFDFSQIYTLSNPAGEGSNWNYECPLVNKDSFKTAWKTFDGHTLYFIRTQTSQDQWIDDQGEGYKLITEDVDILNGDYYNAKIESPDGLIYTFGARGKIRRIDDSEGNYIIVKYNETTQPESAAPQDYITSIENNSGYRYLFVYDYKLFDGSEISKHYLKQIQYQKKAEDEKYYNVNIDGVDITLTYDYILLPNGNIALSKVTYPHSESEEELAVEYHYDTNGRLTDIFDIDKRKLNIKYTGEIPDYANQTNTNPDATRIVDNYPSAFLLTEEVLNKEYSSEVEGSQEYLPKSFLEIKRHLTYQREFTDNSENKEIIHYNQMLKPLYYTNDNGESYYVDYVTYDDKQYVSQIVSPENIETLNPNGNFEDVDDWDNVPYEWSSEGSFSLSSVGGSLDGNGSYYAKVSGTISEERYATQFVRINGISGQTFVVGGLAKANSAVPTNAHFFGIEIYKAIDNGEENAPTQTNELIYRLAFDPTMDNEVQYRLGAFKLTEAAAVIEFRFVYSYQNSYAEFDNALIYNASEENVTFFDIPSSNTNINYPDDSSSSTSDNTQTDVLSDGVNQMISKYEYSPSANYLERYTDNNDVVTNYSYDNNSGLLKEKSVSVNGTSKALIDYYSYDAMGALKEVSRVVNSLSNATTGASYTHEYGKISSVVHNNMTYNFNYDSFGNLKNIIMEPEPNDDIPTVALISYDYSTDENGYFNTITYSNGKVLGYSYDENGRITSISDCSDSSSTDLYTYDYDDNSGNVSEIKDYTSKRIISYSDNLVEIHELEINSGNEGELIFSKQINENGSEDFNVLSVSYSKTPNNPTYNSESKTTSYSSSISMYGDYSITFESNAVCDYFGRIKSSSVSYTPENSSDTHSIVNESEYLNNSNNSATTNLLGTYTSTISNGSSASSEELNKFVSRYEYDYAGRITHVYYGDNNISEPILAYYYEYDIAGQLIKEADFLGAKYTEYSYDNFGNITEKRIYSGENSFVYRYGTVSPSSGVNATDVISYQYQNYIGDVLEKYDDNYIPTDLYGNPEKYYRIDDEGTTTFILEWEGNQLHTVRPTNEDALYEYKYDAEGNRTQKIIYSNVDSNLSGEPIIEQVVDYVWDDNRISGYRICISPEDNPITIESVVLYDELGNPIGLRYSMDGLTTNDEITYGLAEEDIFWFIKDGQGNIKAIYSEKTRYTIGCSYINNQLSINFSDTFIEDLNEKLSAIDDNKEIWRVFFAYAISLQYAPLISIDAAQATHYSYIMDVETGLCYCQNRYYSPEYGRFINIGEIEQIAYDLENPFNANPYVYYNNDPINCKGTFYNSKSSTETVGMQVELSKSLISFADSVGMEFVYDSVKDELYAYYYSDTKSNSNYMEMTLKKVQNIFGRLSLSSNISLKNLAVILKMNNRVPLSCFNVQTDKDFVWPISYLGVAKIKHNNTNGYSGYVAYGSGYQSKGVCYYPAPNLGSGFNELSVKYTKVDIESPMLKNYLSANKDNIVEATK